MTRIDNTNVFIEGVYSDATILVPANTTYKVGTVLGRNADKVLTGYTSDVADSTPLYILAQTLINDTAEPATYDLVRVFDSGVVDAQKLTFVKEADATSVEVLDALKTNNIRLVNVAKEIGVSGLAE